MNVLPLVLLILTLLSVITVQKFQKFQNDHLIQKEYLDYIRENELFHFNERQDKMKVDYNKTHKIFSFRLFVNEEERKKALETERQMRLIFKDLVREIYGHTTFFKEFEASRPHGWDELLDRIIQVSAQRTSKETLKEMSEIASLELGDEGLQKIFYKILKGSISWKERTEAIQDPSKVDPIGYPSLLHYINFTSVYPINISRAPRELLKAIFLDDQVVKDILRVRSDTQFWKKSNFKDEFKELFCGKQRKEIGEELLDFKICKTKKTEYD